MAEAAPQRYASFADFYPVYLSEHANRVARTLHFAGTTLALLALIALLLTGNLFWLLCALLSQYGFAWLGHFAYERNQPETVRHPLYSFMAGWVLYWQILTGQDSF